jgi:hypothetical protein
MSSRKDQKILLVSLLFISTLSCTRKSEFVEPTNKSTAKSIAVGDNAEDRLKDGETATLPIIFQDKYQDRASGTLVSCLYRYDRGIVIKGDSYEFVGSPTKPITMNEKAIVYANIGWYSIGAISAELKKLKNDPEFKKSILYHVGAVALAIVHQRMSKSVADLSPEPLTAIKDKPWQFIVENVGEIRKDFFDRFKSVTNSANDVRKLIMSIQSDDLQEGEVRGFADLLAFRVFENMVKEAGKKALYLKCPDLDENFVAENFDDSLHGEKVDIAVSPKP